MFKILIASVLLLVSCGANVMHPQESTVSNQRLTDTRKLYMQSGGYGWDEYGSNGDGLLFACLSAVAHGKEFDVEAAMDEPGHWYRNPGMINRPLQPGESTISRDMFVGLFAYILHFKRLDLAEQIWDWGEAHSWKMGDETKFPETRVYLTPDKISLLAKIIKHLGGADHKVARLAPILHDTKPGFTGHLTALSIQMLGIINGGIGSYELSSLKKIRDGGMSHNPLILALVHKYTDGDQSETIKELTGTWPEDRLPNTEQDWCEEWRVQRIDSDSGLRKCPNVHHTHSGADFLYVVNTLINTES